MKHDTNQPRHQSGRWRSMLVLLAVLLLGGLAWRGPDSSAADSGALPVYLPLIDAPMGCFPTSGTYPIAVRDIYLDANGFVNPDGYYSDEIYQNKTWKRVIMHDSSLNPNGGFSWLRWRVDQPLGNVISVTASLTGTGNLGAGFDEVIPWPASSSVPPPPGYPLNPHHLNPGDWAYGDSGIPNSTALRAALDYQIARRTLMILPIYDSSIGPGPNATNHISRPGAFLLRGYSLTGVAYLDLVYIEQPNLVPCTG